LFKENKRQLFTAGKPSQMRPMNFEQKMSAVYRRRTKPNGAHEYYKKLKMSTKCHLFTAGVSRPVDPSNCRGTIFVKILTLSMRSSRSRKAPGTGTGTVPI
jgi:hypothetical protein